MNISLDPNTEAECQEILGKGKVTGREMCFVISECCRFEGKKVKPEEIWGSSPTGELFHVYLMYKEVKSRFEGSSDKSSYEDIWKI